MVLNWLESCIELAWTTLTFGSVRSVRRMVRKIGLPEGALPTLAEVSGVLEVQNKALLSVPGSCLTCCAGKFPKT